MTRSEILLQKLNNTRSKWLDLGTTTMYDKPYKDKWSRIEILGHLIDSARYNLVRFTEASFTSDEVYHVQGYDQNRLVDLQAYQQMTGQLVIDQWISINQTIAHVWDQFQSQTWKKPIDVKGHVYDLAFLAEDYLVHLQHHLDQIFIGASRKMTVSGITLGEATSRFQQITDGKPFIELLRHGDLSVEYYKPNKVDLQQPHTRDELYVIIAGRGSLIIEDKSYPFVPHDVLFVKAGDEHRFVDFSDDFSTWVVFYGIENKV
jgi:hypothetical protein